MWMSFGSPSWRLSKPQRLRSGNGSGLEKTHKAPPNRGAEHRERTDVCRGISEGEALRNKDVICVLGASSQPHGPHYPVSESHD